MSQVKIAPEIEAKVQELLGRAPRGLEEVVVSDADGAPVVICVPSLADDKPFPTMLWLVDRGISYRIDREEAGGLINQLQHRINAEPALRQPVAADHEAQIQLRNEYISPATRAGMEALDFYGVLQERGIGGIADFSRIRCLHTWYAKHQEGEGRW
jgi:hypothetical protein